MITQPQPTEYSAYAEAYVSLSRHADDVLELLTVQGESTAGLFLNLPADKGEYRYAHGKWSVKEMLLHVIDTERVFAYRALCVARGERENLPGFEQDDYAELSEAGKRTMEDLVTEFKAVRLATIYLLRSFSTFQANRVGLANGNPVSARALAYMIAGHELYHLNVLQERYL